MRSGWAFSARPTHVEGVTCEDIGTARCEDLARDHGLFEPRAIDVVF